MTTRLDTIQQLIKSKTELQSHMKENLLQSMRKKMVEDDDKIKTTCGRERN